MARRKSVSRPYHGPTLDDYILNNIGRFGLQFHILYDKIVDDYGSVSKRTIHRRLVKLRLSGKIEMTIESRPETYYRLSKTER